MYFEIYANSGKASAVYSVLSLLKRGTVIESGRDYIEILQTKPYEAKFEVNSYLVEITNPGTSHMQVETDAITKVAEDIEEVLTALFNGEL